jgi:hypothetical protein
MKHKYLYLIIGVIFVGCSGKNMTLRDSKTKIETEKQEIAKVKSKPKLTTVTLSQNKIKEKIEEKIIVEEEVVVDEPKIKKKIKYDVPRSCAMWSDGCNVCTRIDAKKASCTTYPECHNRIISCLKWN